MTNDEERDWRLQTELAGPSGTLEQLVMHLRGPDPVREVKSGVGPDVVVTHDGRQLFAYAASRSALDRARATITATLRDREIEASEKVSHWDPELDEWLQVEPAPTGTRARSAEDHRRAADTPDTRTLVADVGREVRKEFEQSLLNYAGELGVGMRDRRAPSPAELAGRVPRERYQAQAGRVRRRPERRGAGHDPHRAGRDDQPALRTRQLEGVPCESIRR